MKDFFPEDVVEPLCAATGHLIVSWAYVEACLDYNTAIVFHAAGGRHLDSQIPQALNRKIKFLRRCFKQIDALSAHANEFLPYLEKAEQLSKTRHLVAHGFATEYDDTNQRFRFTKLNLINGRTLHKGERSWLPVRQLLDEAIDCQELTRNMLAFTERFLEAMVPGYDPKNLIR